MQKQFTRHFPNRTALFILALITCGVLQLIISPNVSSQTNWTHHTSNPALKLGAAGAWDDY